MSAESTEAKGLTFSKLEQDPWSSQIVRALETKLGKPLPHDVQDYLVDSIGNADVRAKQKHDWIRQTAELALTLKEGKPHPA